MILKHISSSIPILHQIRGSDYIYNPSKLYKKHKVNYKQFILFIKNKNKYITYQNDSKILYYLTRYKTDEDTFIVNKKEFYLLVEILNENHLNVALAGKSIIKEYYANTFNEYDPLKRKSRKCTSYFCYSIVYVF